MPFVTFAYQYLVGGAVFFVALALVLRSGAADPSSRSGRRYVAILLAGLTLYAVAHAVSVFILPRT